MLVLVGAQGAGKSTFCKELQRKTERPGGHRRWARVNQDTIASGWCLFRAAVMVRFLWGRFFGGGAGLRLRRVGFCGLQTWPLHLGTACRAQKLPTRRSWCASFMPATSSSGGHYPPTAPPLQTAAPASGSSVWRRRSKRWTKGRACWSTAQT